VIHAALFIFALLLIGYILSWMPGGPMVEALFELGIALLVIGVAIAALLFVCLR
jgi:hypothetical protein